MVYFLVDALRWQNSHDQSYRYDFFDNGCVHDNKRVICDKPGCDIRNRSFLISCRFCEAGKQPAGMNKRVRQITAAEALLIYF
jgi:hypothetical protein